MDAFLDSLVRQHYPIDYARIHKIPLPQKKTIDEIRAENLQKFFDARARRCKKCGHKVTATTSAGGRFKRYHFDCAPSSN